MRTRPTTPLLRGFTLVELLITLVIGAILMAIAVPSMQGFIARKRVEGAAAELVTDLRYLRSAQITRQLPVRIRFSVTDTTSCYVMYIAVSARGLAECDCANTPACPNVPGAQEQLKAVSIARSSGVEMRSVPEFLELRGSNGLPLDNRLLRTTLSSRSGGEVRVETNPVGRPSMCSVSGHDSSLQACN